jgi:hypothetical protein
MQFADGCHAIGSDEYTLFVSAVGHVSAVACIRRRAFPPSCTPPVKAEIIRESAEEDVTRRRHWGSGRMSAGDFPVDGGFYESSGGVHVGVAEKFSQRQSMTAAFCRSADAAVPLR